MSAAIKQKFAGVSKLRMMNRHELRKFAATDEVLILAHHSQPIAAMVPYDLYMKWQNVILAVKP